MRCPRRSMRMEWWPPCSHCGSEVQGITRGSTDVLHKAGGGEVLCRARGGSDILSRARRESNILKRVGQQRDKVDPGSIVTSKAKQGGGVMPIARPWAVMVYSVGQGMWEIVLASSGAPSSTKILRCHMASSQSHVALTRYPLPCCSHIRWFFSRSAP